MIWRFEPEKFPDGRGLHYRVRCGSEIAFLDRILTALDEDAEFRTQFSQELGAASFTAIRWETPPATSETIRSKWEFVVHDSPGLARKPDRGAFAEHFDSNSSGVVSFSNLGRDAMLVVPCPRAADEAYGHLAAFVRSAPIEHQHSLWRAVAAAMRQRIGLKPVWLSTAGAGVPWLHVRLDDRPKYYGYAPYAA